MGVHRNLENLIKIFRFLIYFHPSRELDILLKMAGRHLTMQTVQGVRAFSSSASAMNLVKAPVAVFGIEGRYATALYSAASKQKALDAFSVQLKKDTRRREFILDPSIKKNLKVDGV